MRKSRRRGLDWRQVFVSHRVDRAARGGRLRRGYGLRPPTALRWNEATDFNVNAVRWNENVAPRTKTFSSANSVERVRYCGKHQVLVLFPIYVSDWRLAQIEIHYSGSNLRLYLNKLLSPTSKILHVDFNPALKSTRMIGIKYTHTNIFIRNLKYFLTLRHSLPHKSKK